MRRCLHSPPPPLAAGATESESAALPMAQDPFLVGVPVHCPLVARFGFVAASFGRVGNAPSRCCAASHFMAMSGALRDTMSDGGSHACCWVVSRLHMSRLVSALAHLVQMGARCWSLARASCRQHGCETAWSDNASASRSSDFAPFWRPKIRPVRFAPR